MKSHLQNIVFRTGRLKDKIKIYRTANVACVSNFWKSSVNIHFDHNRLRFKAEIRLAKIIKGFH